MGDLTINGDTGGLRLSWPRVAVVVIFLVVGGAMGGRIIANQEAQKVQNAVTQAQIATLADKVDRLTIAVELLKQPPRTDNAGRLR